MTHNWLRWHHISALAGALAWLPLLVLLPDEPQTIALITRLLLLAVLVFVPLALGLAAIGCSARGAGRLQLAVRVQPFAAAATVTAFLLPAGTLSGVLASNWLLFAGIVALLGVTRLFDHDLRDAAELCINVSLLLLPIGGFWLTMTCFGVRPLGFGDTIVLLTAVHFHYAGFALLMLAGLAGRRLRAGAPGVWGIFRLVVAGMIAGVPLVALGITFSRVLEILAVLLLTSSVLALALLTLVAVVPRLARRDARALLVISALASVVTMLLAAGYAGGSTVGLALTIPQMVLAHGAVNAFGLVLCGLLAWTLELSMS
jgi:YndJ-like protein